MTSLPRTIARLQSMPLRLVVRALDEAARRAHVAGLRNAEAAERDGRVEHELAWRAVAEVPLRSAQ